MWPVRKPDAPSRLLSVACAIESKQVRRTKIAAEVATLEARLERLAEEEETLAQAQLDLARQMDKLTVGSSLAV